ncbi:MAG TPA: extracellular solute-binding protein [Anaerolineae bacterium]|nr:extracellular solute-binding protein [Anaerolineae bacterium]
MSKKQIRASVIGLVILAMLLTACAPIPTPQAVEKVAKETAAVAKETAVTPIVISWWSHWANEPAKRKVIEKIAADYEAEHPNVSIEVTWWDKNPLRDAIRSTMTAGEGAPDITTFDSSMVEWVEAGWLLDLTDVLPWDNFTPGTDKDGTYPGLGYPGHYKLNLGASYYMLFYNPDIFKELGIEVPENYQFTEDEFLNVVKQCHDAGYAGVADAIGNRPYPAVWAVQYPLFNLVGPEEFDKYNSGQKSWDTPEARKVLEYSVALRDAGLWPDTFATMTIDEFHVYFHTQHKACMFFIPSWYAGRAFKPVEEGGQDPNWHFGMLRYPRMDGCKACDTVWLGFESGYGVLSSTKYPEVAKDILAFAAQPKYGALWTAVTNIPSVIKFDKATNWPSDETLKEMGVEPGKWDWYWEEFNKVYGGLPTGMAPTARCGSFNDAVVSALNEGLPEGLIAVDEAVETLNAALCK